jgi:hypothetical protein
VFSIVGYQLEELLVDEISALNYDVVIDFNDIVECVRKLDKQSDDELILQLVVAFDLINKNLSDAAVVEG